MPNTSDPNGNQPVTPPKPAAAGRTIAPPTGSARVVRTSYVHEYMADGSALPFPITDRTGILGCGQPTIITAAQGVVLSKNPRATTAHCQYENADFPVAQFHWDGTNDQVGA